MAQTNQIGIENQHAAQLSEKMNTLLANLQVFYINVRGFHWNITGERFFELHAKFEELYNDLLVKIDEVAERTLTLGCTPTHSFTEYVKRSGISEAINVSEGRQAVQLIVEGLQQLLLTERDILHLAGEAADEGTSSLMSDYIRQQEKLIWMYGAYLK